MNDNIPADALGNYGGVADMPTVPDINFNTTPRVTAAPKKAMSFNDIYQQSLNRGPAAKVASVPLSSMSLGDRYKTVVPYEDTEEMYAQQQSAASKWLNAGLKTAGTFTSSFIGGTAGLMWGIGEAIATQRLAALADNAVNRKVDDITTGLEDILPNYYTHREIESDAISTDNLLSANFWSNKGLQNLGFAAGALAGGGVWSKILKSIGLLNGAVLAGRGMETATAIEEAMTAAPNAAKYTAFDGALNSTIRKYGINQVAQGLKQSERLTISTLGAWGEGSIESIQKMKQFREELTNQFLLENGRLPQGDELQRINDYTDNVGKYVLAGNLMLLSATNYLQLPKILGSSRRFDKALINQVEQKQLGGAWSSVVSEGITKFGKRAYNAAGLVFSPSEAFEEAGQYAIQEGVASYFNKAYKNKHDADETLSKIYGSMNSVLGEGWDKVFTEKDGIESLLLGGISGGIQQSGIVGTYRNEEGKTRVGFGKSGEIAERGWFGEGGERAANTEIALKALDKSRIKDQLQTQAKYLSIAIGAQQERQGAIVDNDILKEKDAEHDYVMSYVMPRVLYGKEESVYQELDSYAKQAATEQGFDDLVTSGVVSPKESPENFIARITNLKNLTKSVVNTYENIRDRYEDVRTEDGKRVYSDDLIEKMVYATSKIDNYDQRIPNINQDLTAFNIPTFDLLARVASKEMTSNEAFQEGVEKIDELDTSDGVKDTLKLNLRDLLRASALRKLFIDEYKSIKETPQNWKAPEISAEDLAQEASKQKTPPAPPAAAQQTQATPTATPPAPATSSSPDQVEPSAQPQPADQPIVEKPTISFTNKRGEEETLQEGREYINKGYNERDILHKFKVVKINEDGTVSAELVDGSIVSFKPELFAGAERVRDGRDTIIDNAQEIKDIQDALEDKSDFSTGTDRDEYNGPKEEGLPSAERLFFRTKTASSINYPNGLPINITRYNEFSNNVDSFPNRKNIRFVYVTPNQQNELGLARLAELSYMKGDDFVSSPEWVESITGVDKNGKVVSEEGIEKGLVVAVFVEFDNGKLFLIDKDGKRIKNQDGSEAVLGNPNNNFDIKQTIFSTTPTTKGEGRSSEDPKLIEQFRQAWKDERRKLFTATYQPGDPIDSYEFGLSKGHAVKQLDTVQRNSVSKVFGKIKQSVINGVQGLIEVSTLGYITHKDGIAYKFAVGRPVLKYGDKLEYLQNDKITPNQAVSIVEILKKLHDVLIDTSMSKEQKIKENNKMLTYLKGVLFWSSRKSTMNSFYINYATGDIVIADKTFDFSDVEGQRTQIIEALLNVYTNTSNELLTKYFNEPFYEQYWDGKELKEREWKNYQSYLLSDVMPDNKTKRNTAPPLTVNITIPSPAVPYAYEQKYAFPTNFKVVVPQASTAATQTAAPSGKKVSEATVLGVPVKFTYDGTKVSIVRNDASDAAIEALIKSNPNLSALDPQVAYDTVNAAIVKKVEELVNVQPVPATPQGYATDGTTVNTFTLQGVNFRFTHNGVKATLDLSPEFQNGELIEGVDKMIASRPEFANVDREQLRDSLITAAEKAINAAVADQIAAQAPVQQQAPTTDAETIEKRRQEEILDTFSPKISFEEFKAAWENGLPILPGSGVVDKSFTNIVVDGKVYEYKYTGGQVIKFYPVTSSSSIDAQSIERKEWLEKQALTIDDLKGKELRRDLYQYHTAIASSLSNNSLVEFIKFSKRKNILNDINAKYDAELAALEGKSTAPVADYDTFFDNAINQINDSLGKFTGLGMYSDSPMIIFRFDNREESFDYLSEPISKEGENYRIKTGRYNVLIDNRYNIISVTSEKGKTFTYAKDKIGDSTIDIESKFLDPLIYLSAQKANKVIKLQTLNEVLDNYGLTDQFKFISPLLAANNVQVTYEAAELPKVASIDTEVVDGKYKITLVINKAVFDTKSKTQQMYIIAHEFVHGLIKVKLNEKGDIKGTELYKGLTDIYQSVEDYFHKASSGIDKTAAFILTDNFSKKEISDLRQMLDYISQSPEEMATIGLTDPRMIKFLKLMPGTAPAYTKQSLFAQLADMISKFLGLSNSKFNDLLTFMSEQLEQSTAAPNAGLGLANTAQDYIQQPAPVRQGRKRNQFPEFEQLSAEQKYYLVEDFKAKFYVTLYRDNHSIFNVDKNSANAIFKGIVDNYKSNGAQFTDEQYMEVIDATKRQLASLYISFNGDELATINDESASDRLYAPEAFSVNLKKSTPFAVKILNSSLLKTDGVHPDNPSYLPIPKLNEKHGTLQLIPESEVYSTLVNKLTNVKSADDFVNKLYDIAKSNADYVQLFVKLGGNMVTGKVDFDSMSNSDFRLFVAAMQTYTKAKPEMFIQYLKEDSTFRGAADLTNGAKQVEKRWINNMILSAKIENSGITYNSDKKQFEANIDPVDPSSPEKMINFLNKLGITFTKPIYDKLTESQLETFTKAVIKLSADISAAKTKGIVTLKKGKFKTLGNGISRLAELFTAVEMPNQNNSIYNAEGKRINTLTESNAPSLFEYQFNSIMNVSEIAEKMPQLLDMFSQSSQILKPGGPIFNEDGERRMDPDTGKPIELKVQVISGEIDTDEGSGSGVSRMTQSDRLITQINQNINGSYYILVPADSVTEWMMNLGNRISYKQYAEGRGTAKAVEIMKEHLDADIELALDAKNRELLKNVGEKGRDLRFFKDVLSKDLLTELDSLIEKRVNEDITEEEFRTELDAFKTKNNEVIEKNITDYLISSRDSLVKTLEDVKLVRLSGATKENEALYRFDKLDANFQDELRELSGVNVNSMTKEDVNVIAEFLSTNYILNNIEFHKILFGDPYQFAIKNKNGKTILDETKRVKIFLSPRKFSVDFPELNDWLNEDNIIQDGEEEIELTSEDYGYHENKSYINVSVIKDVEIVGGLYTDVDTNEADAFSMTSPGFYKEVKRKNDQWSDEADRFHNWQMAYARQKLAAKDIYKGYETKPALKKYDEKLLAEGPGDFVTDVMKPVVSGDKFGKITIDLVGHKMSQMPLYYQAVEGTALEDLFIKMFNENRDYIVMESGGKVGTLEKRHELYTDGKMNSEPFNNLIQVPFKAYGIQVETGYKDKKGQTLGSQPTKIATIDLFSGGEAIGDTPERQQFIKEAVERHDNALKRLYTEAADSLIKDFGITIEDDEFVLNDKKKVADILRNELITEDASDNLIASLEINPETNDFVTPLESSPNYMQIVRLLYSVMHKRIVSPKVNGMSAVQVPVTGWEASGKGRRVIEINGKKVLTDDTLKFYEDKDENGVNLRYCEIYTTLPKQARALFSDKTKFPNDDAIVDYLNKQAPDALMGIGFRIPTQGLNSMERFKIKALLPDFMGTTVVVPSEITTKVGSDFDIDKLNMYIKSLYKDALGNIRALEYKGSEEATKEFYGQVFDQMTEKEQRYISRQLDEADYEDVELQEKLIGKQEKLNDKIADREKYVNKMYRQAIENEYYSAIDTLLGLPENFKRLTTPNSTDVLMGLADEMDKLTGYDESNIKNRILDMSFMSFLRHAFITGKSWIGISATATTGHSNAQKAGTFVDHVFKLSLPHNKTADGKVDLSQRMFAETKKRFGDARRFISDILSEFTSGFADAGNDPFIFKLIYSDQIVSSAMFLTRGGVDPEYSMAFLNQPIVRDFVTTADAEGKYILSEMTRESSLLLDEIRSKYAASEAAVERNTEYDVENLWGNIGVKLTDDQKAQQLLILEEFFSVAKGANGLFIITEATNYDTAKFANADDFRRKQMKTLTQYKFEDDSFRISSAKNLLDKTHLRTLVNALTKVNRAFGTILRFNTPSYRAIINKVIDTYAVNDFLSKDKFSRIANKLTGSLLDYIIQTNVNYDVAKLVQGKDSVISKFQKALETHPDMKILQDLEVIPGRTIVAPATIALKVAPETAADKNRYTEGFRELRDNAETNDLYNGLVKLAIVQGTYKTAASYREVVPEEDIAAEITKSVNAPGVVERLQDFYKNARFQRDNFNDPNIAPRVTPPMIDVPEANVETPWGTTIEAYSFTSAISFTRKGAESARDLIGLHPKSKGGAYDFVTISRAIAGPEGDMIDFETGYAIQPADYAAEMQKDESMYNRIYGYQKVKYADGTPVKIKMDEYSPEQYVYKLVNLYGDGRFLTEHHNTLQKSELNNGTVKVDKEFSDDSIIKALDNQGKLVGYTQIAAPVAAQPSTQPTAVQMQQQNVEKLLNGTKTTTIRASIEKGGNIPVGETKVVNFGGKDFNVTNRGYLTIEEAGGKEAMLKSEGVKNESELMYKQSRDWMNGKGSMYVYDITPTTETVAEQQPLRSSGFVSPQLPANYKKVEVSDAEVFIGTPFSAKEANEIQLQIDNEFNRSYASQLSEDKFGKARRSLYFSAFPYAYSGTVRSPKITPSWLIDTIGKVEQSLGVEPGYFDIALINEYKTGDQKIGFHTDNEAMLNANNTVNPTVVTVSFGDTRTMILQSMETGKETSFEMPNGSVAVMGYDSQIKYKHGIKQEQGKGLRFSITLRHNAENRAAQRIGAEKPEKLEILEKLEYAKNKLESFDLTADGIFYNYFRSGARIKPGSFDKLVDRNKRSASTNGAYTSTKGAYSYDSLARQAYEASNMEVDDTVAVEALEEFLSNYPDTWKTPYENIINEIKDLENQLKSIEKSTEKVVSSQLSLFDDNQPEGLPAIDRSPKKC